VILVYKRLHFHDDDSNWSAVWTCVRFCPGWSVLLVIRRRWCRSRRGSSFSRVGVTAFGYSPMTACAPHLRYTIVNLIHIYSKLSRRSREHSYLFIWWKLCQINRFAIFFRHCKEINFQRARIFNNTSTYVAIISLYAVKFRAFSLSENAC